MQQITTNKNDIKQGKIPHEIFTVNVVIINLFLAVAVLKFWGADFAIMISMSISLSIIIWSYFKNKQVQKTDNCFIKINWQLSVNRYKYLITGYILYFIILGIGSLLSNDAKSSMDGTNIIYTVFNILSIVPLFIAILTSTIVGSGSMFNVSKGEVPAKMIDKYC